MAKQYEIAEKDYILGMSYKDIAAKYNVSVATVKTWKNRYKWEREKPVKKPKKVNTLNTKKQKGIQKYSEPEEDLTEKEQLFCYHYVRTWNLTQAALLAGYGNGNKVCAQVQGSRLYQRPRVKQEIDRLKDLFRQEIHVDIQDFLAFCMKVVGADIGDYVRFGAVDRVIYDDNGPMKDEDGNVIKEPVNCVSLGESEQLDTSIIQEVKQGKDGISIKLADKKWAWEQLAKYFDWLPDKWQRKIEQDKLDLETRKVKAMEEKSGVNETSSSVTIIDDIGDDHG